MMYILGYFVGLILILLIIPFIDVDKEFFNDKHFGGSVVALIFWPFTISGVILALPFYLYTVYYEKVCDFVKNRPNNKATKKAVEKISKPRNRSGENTKVDLKKKPIKYPQKSSNETVVVKDDSEVQTLLR